MEIMNPIQWKSARKNYMSLVVLVLFLLQQHIRFLSFVEATTNVYIVYLGEKKHDDPVKTKNSHYKLLSDFLGSEEAAKKYIIYSYKHGFSGFAARLTDAEAKAIAKLPEVVKVIRNHMLKLQTTRSWDFMGIHHNAPTNLLTKNLGKGIIIGVVDTGVWPESESFNDEGMPPIPSHWKGICQKGEGFNKSHCNGKIIGARWFAKGYLEQLKQQNITEYPDFLSARDNDGHGSHCASTAAGNFVKNANFRNLGGGLARGGAPRAHLAIYKISWGTEGQSTAIDLLKGFDTAIGDGVDVISCSNSPETIPKPLYKDDIIGIGAFHAIAKGITVVSGAGNMGPVSQTVSNFAPWQITVAASTIDRAFQAPITLGNNRTFWGQSFNAGKNSHVFGELVYSENVTLSESPNCELGSLKPSVTKGKVVLCFSTTKEVDMGSAAAAVAVAGGVGIIYAQFHEDGVFADCPISCVKVDYQVGSQILEYIDSARSPTAKLSSANTVLGKTTSPRVASFSSRGPSSLNPEVLKPDVAAPGVDIIAAYIPLVPKLKPLHDGLKPTFSPGSGTSMATPHVAGIVALIKSVHKSWSPAVIKSALVTTASQTATDGTDITAEGSIRKTADPFDFGGGQVNPSKVLDPGLVYDVTTSDYIQYLCYLGLGKSSIIYTGQKKLNCTQKGSFGLDLNLPSVSVPNLKLGTTTTITRTVTNVGDLNSVYKAIIEDPPGIKMTVEPEVLKFNSATKGLSFKVSFSSAQKLHGDYKFGSLTWSDGKHLVRSPVAVRVIAFDSFFDV